MTVQMPTQNSEECIDAVFLQTLLVPPEIHQHEVRILQSNLGDGGNCRKAAIWGNQHMAMRKFKPGGRSEADLKEVCALEIRNGVANLT